MAGEEETTTDQPRPVRPVLLTYKKKKSRVFSPSPDSQQIVNKNRDQTDLSLCHSCGLNFRNLDPNLKSNSICILKSEWRILLLCKTCLSRIKSGDCCSYCLQSKPDDVVIPDVAALEFLQCIKCSCRVHCCCLPREHRHDFATWHKLGKGGADSFFTCIDCTPVPNFCLRNKNGAVLELISKEIDSDVAIGILSEKKDDDMNVAIQVHLEINGSQRVSKKILNSSKVIQPDSKVKKCKSDVSNKKGASFGPIRCKHKDMNDKLNSIKYGFDSVVLALESVRSVAAPLNKDKVFNDDLEKMDQNENQEETGAANSNLRTVNGHDRCEMKYKRKKLLLGDSIGTVLAEKWRYHQKSNMNYSNHNEGQERETGTRENQGWKDRYEKKYKRRKWMLRNLMEK